MCPRFSIYPDNTLTQWSRAFIFNSYSNREYDGIALRRRFNTLRIFEPDRQREGEEKMEKQHVQIKSKHLF